MGVPPSAKQGAPSITLGGLSDVLLGSWKLEEMTCRWVCLLLNVTQALSLAACASWLRFFLMIPGVISPRMHHALDALDALEDAHGHEVLQLSSIFMDVRPSWNARYALTNCRASKGRLISSRTRATIKMH